jgi:predicted translin family RNA/ssDNA-binding protein
MSLRFKYKVIIYNSFRVVGVELRMVETKIENVKEEVKRVKPGEKEAKEKEAKKVAKAIDRLTNSAAFPKLLHAVDNRNETEFYEACNIAGNIPDDMKKYLLRLAFMKSVYDTKTLGDAPYCWS